MNCGWAAARGPVCRLPSPHRNRQQTRSCPVGARAWWTALRLPWPHPHPHTGGQRARPGEMRSRRPAVTPRRVTHSLRTHAGRRSRHVRAPCRLLLATSHARMDARATCSQADDADPSGVAGDVAHVHVRVHRVGRAKSSDACVSCVKKTSTGWTLPLSIFIFITNINNGGIIGGEAPPGRSASLFGAPGIEQSE